MIKVMLRIPLEHTYMTIKVKASSPVKIMESLESMIRETGNKTADEFWAKEFGFRYNKPKITAANTPQPIIEKTIIKGKETPAAVNPDERYSFIDKNGEPHTCNRCKGFISWDKYPDVKHPIHVDGDGKPIGDGSCPNF